ncbi:MAG: hypothetical protein EPO68_16925 [Planctomycetota bacterium]|nr:MAG: hypothetical protein EPO68_16925 [Planctomycetota bacterium]
MIRRTWLALALVPIAALIVYSIELLGRVLRNEHGTHIGLDVIQICYASAAAGLVGASVACVVCRRSRVERLAARAALVLALVAAAGFCALHWSGKVFAYHPKPTELEHS